MKITELVKEENVKQNKEAENAESDKRFEIKLFKFIEANEQYAHLILDHPHVVKICESLDAHIILSTLEFYTMNPKTLE